MKAREESMCTQLLEATRTVIAKKRERDDAAATTKLSLASGLLMELKTASEATLTHMGCRAAEEEEAGQRIADADDELRALKYERSRLRSEIAECAQPAEEKDLPTLDMAISMEEARRVRARGADMAQTGHQEALFRLGVERDERARLCAERDALAAQLETLRKAAAVAAERKASVDVQLETVASAAASLQGQMPPSHTVTSSFASSHGLLLQALPSPLYTLALGISAYILQDTSHATMEIIGDADAAQSFSPRKGGRSAPATDAPPRADGFAAHPLSVCLAVRGAKATATVTFKYHPELELLTASAEPAAADAAMRDLGASLPKVGIRRSASTADVPAGAHNSAVATACAAADDGSVYPDLSSLLLARTLAANQPNSSTKGTSEVAPLLPSRPYKWLQWLGAIGPLLNVPPQPSQPVLQALVAAVSGAIERKK
jgi:hypothetical protein